MCDAWHKYDTSIKVGVNETGTSVTTIPFPAVTICFETKAYKSRVNYEHFFNAARTNDQYPYGLDNET